MSGDPDEAVDALRHVRPAVDLARLEASRARLRAALSAVNEPARIGRYELLEQVGSGGMGVVYAARDPQIDRKVALKLLRVGMQQTSADRARLLREAQALGRLGHPNVVTVHAVELIREQLVIVMELVEGLTLAAWASAQPRSWRDVVEVYVQAGRGLAAAHAIGIVHRDFKPSNAILGRDGRVRVLDFGLAQMATIEAQPPSDSATDSVTSLTATGALPGTLAYMAPEQLTGDASAASDQWSFCVSMYEALHGVRPFAGDSVDAVRVAITQADVPAGTRAVPSWLHALLVRGLARDPARRHPSMALLIDELVRERGWRRWRWPAVTVGSLAVAAGALALGRGDVHGVEPCDGSPGELAKVWGNPQAARLERHFAALRVPYAAEAWSRIARGLDERAALWSRLDQEICTAHRRGTLSADLHDQEFVCLRRRLDDLRHAVDVLGEVDATSVASAVDVVARMAPLEWCVDPVVLASEVEPPANAFVRPLVDELHRRLRRVEALERAARITDALAEVDGVLWSASLLGHQATQVDALLIKSRILILSNRLHDAVTPLRAAETRAAAQGRIAASVIAGARRIYAEGLLERDLSGLARQAESLEPWSEAIERDPLARPLLLNNIGTMHLVARRRDLAQRYFEAAREARARIATPDPELNVIESNLALVSEDPLTRSALSEAAWHRASERLGPNHPIALQARFFFALALADPERALVALRDTASAYETYHPDATAIRVELAVTAAFVAADLGAVDVAATELARIVALTRSSTSPRLQVAHALASAELALLVDRRVTDPFAEVRALIDGRDDWSSSMARAASLFDEGAHALRTGDRRRSVEALERAVELYDGAAALGTSADLARRRARAQWALADALRGQAAAEPRRQQLLDDARRYYEATGAQFYVERARAMR